MPDYHIILPSKPVVLSEDNTSGSYEIDGLYPGYGQTLGNALRRIILSSLPGYAITSIKIDGVPHEFSVIDGVKEDVVTICLNLKKVRFKVVGDEPLELTISAKGQKEITAGDIQAPGQVEVVNKGLKIATLTNKNSSFQAVIRIEKGMGYLSKEALKEDKAEIGTIVLDTIFTPIRRVYYEVEPMRVGNRTDYNKLRIFVETDGVLPPREAVECAIRIMIDQLKAIVGFKEPEIEEEITESSNQEEEDETDIPKTKIEDLDLSVRTQKALAGASIRTVAGLTKKSDEDLLDVSGLGEKGIQEIKRALSELGLTLK